MEAKEFFLERARLVKQAGNESLCREYEIIAGLVNEGTFINKEQCMLIESHILSSIPMDFSAMLIIATYINTCED